MEQEQEQGDEEGEMRRMQTSGTLGRRISFSPARGAVAQAHLEANTVEPLSGREATELSDFVAGPLCGREAAKRSDSVGAETQFMPKKHKTQKCPSIPCYGGNTKSPRARSSRYAIILVAGAPVGAASARPLAADRGPRACAGFSAPSGRASCPRPPRLSPQGEAERGAGGRAGAPHIAPGRLRG